jgi:hypothetical protein
MNEEKKKVSEKDALRLSFLHEEIEIITKKIQPEDCGHLKTAVGVLRSQLEDLKKSMFSHA